MNKAKLVAVSAPRTGIVGIETAEQFIGYAARVSNPSNQNNPDSLSLIKYLIKYKHWSPFEMVSVTMEIETTRDIGRQILRHRSFSFQEFSQRYAKAVNFVKREPRLQDSKNRQNSIETDDPDLIEDWYTEQELLLDDIYTAYTHFLERGLAKEQARAILPEGCTMSKLYMAGTLRSWIHYCDLRMAHGTQKEHMEVATLCWEEIKKEFPTIGQAVEQSRISN